MQRNFPAELLDIEAFLLWQCTGYEVDGSAVWTMLNFDGAEWARGKHWKDRPKHTLRWLLEHTSSYIDNLDDRNNHRYHIAMVLDGTGYACLDFDYATYEALHKEADAEGRIRLLAGRAHMDEWREWLEGYTYGEQSKTPGNYHYLFELDREIRKIKDDTRRPMDFLGRGLLILTGFGAGLDVALPSQDDMEMIDKFWPANGANVPFGQMDFNGQLIDLDPVPATLREDGDYNDLLAHLNTVAPWYMTGAGTPPEGENHDLRTNLLTHAAEWAYGMPSARTFIWEALNDSYLPAWHAANSEKNKDRFTNYAKRKYMRLREVSMAMGLAHKNLEHVDVRNQVFNLVQADQARLMEGAKAAAAAVVEQRVEVKTKRRREIPTFPTLPDAGLFALVKGDLVSKMKGEAAPLWQDIHTVWLVQHIISHYVWASGGRMCPQALLGAGSGVGKSALDEMLEDIQGNSSYRQNKRSGGSVGSGAGIRAALASRIYTTVTSEECGADLMRIFAPDAKGHDRDARETLIQAINKRSLKPHLVGKSNAAYSEEEITDFMFASHLATQNANIAQIINEEWCWSGMAMRMPLFLIKPLGFGEGASYNSQPVSKALDDVLSFAGQSFTFGSRYNIETKKYTGDHDYKRAVIERLPELRRMVGGDALSNRVTEVATRYAVVHHAALHTIQPTKQIVGMPEPQDVLTPEDLEFGFLCAQYHVQCLRYVMSSDDSAAQDRGERFERILLLVANHFNKVTAAHKAKEKTGRVKVTPSVIAQLLGSLVGKRGRARVDDDMPMKVTTEEMKHVFEYLESQDVLEKIRGTFVLTTEWSIHYPFQIDGREA